MSTAARFLLEFQATGDQEVIASIKAVGTAGKETAADLEGLSGIEDPFAKVAEGADKAIAPIEEVGTKTDETISIFEGAGTSASDFSANLDAVGGAADATVGGITDANTVTGEFGTSLEGAGVSASDATAGVGEMAGAVTAMGSTIGLAISTVFRMQDAQLALDKANLKAAKSSETARKSAVAFDKLLQSATSNTEGIAIARDELSAAQERLNALQEQGITSGAEYEAAQAAVTAATANLRAEFVAGGGDANKFDKALNAMTNSSKAAEIASRSAEKAAREFGKTQLDTGLAVAALVGQTVGAVAALKDFKTGAEKLAPIFKTLVGAIKPIAGVLTGMAAGFAAFIGIMTAIDQNIGGVKDRLKEIHDAANKAVPEMSSAFDYLGKTFESNVKGFGAWGAEFMKMLGIPITEGPKAAQGAKAATDATVALGTAVETTAEKHRGAIDAAKGNTEALGALQRTNLGLQITQEDFNKAMVQGNTEMDNLATGGGNLTQQMYQLYGAMAQTTDQALELSNLFPQLDSNIQNALLGQKQGMQVATALWDDFNERVKSGQYEVGEFTKYIEDMGYELSPAIQAGVDKLTEMSAAAEDVTVSSKGATAGIKAVGTASADLSSTVGKAANAVSDMNKSLVEQEYSLKATIAGLRDLENQEQGINNALLEVTSNFEKSNQSLREAQAVRADAAAQAQLLQTAINKETESLINEEAALKADIAATTDAEIQALRLSNAKLEGTKAGMEFIASLDEEKASQEANIAALRQGVKAMTGFGDSTVYTADQLQQFAAVAAGVPSAIRDLAGEIGGLAQEATKFLEFAGEENELFGDWDISDKVPDEIRDMMNNADRRFIEGRAQLERTMESLGPLIGVKFANAIDKGTVSGLASLRKFGPEAAALIEQSVGKMDPAVKELHDSLAALGTVTDAQMIPAMQRVVTAMQNAEDPAAALASQMVKLQQQTGASAAPLLQMAGGLEQLSAAGADATVKLSEIPLVTITDDLGNAVAQFANFNGQLVPIPGAANAAAGGLEAMTGAINPLNSAIQAAGASLQQFADYVGDFFASTLPSIVSSHSIKVNPLAPMISASLASLSQFASSVSEQMAKVRAAIQSGLGAAKAGAVGAIPINIDTKPAIASLNRLKTTIAGVKQQKPIQILLNISPALQAANRIRSVVNALPNIRRTITYSYRVVGSRPNPPNLNRTITYRYRTVGSRPAQGGMHETLGQDTMIMAHKGERVDIEPPGQPPSAMTTARVGAGAGGGNSVINVNVKGEVNGKELIRFVRFGLMENTGGVM